MLSSNLMQSVFLSMVATNFGLFFIEHWIWMFGCLDIGVGVGVGIGIGFGIGIGNGNGNGADIDIVK